MKKLIFICMINICSVFYAADKSEPAKTNISQRFPTTIKSSKKPDMEDATALKYDWYEHGLSKEWIGFLQVQYWDNALENTRLSRRMSLGEK